MSEVEVGDLIGAKGRIRFNWIRPKCLPHTYLYIVRALRFAACSARSMSDLEGRCDRRALSMIEELAGFRTGSEELNLSNLQVVLRDTEIAAMLACESVPLDHVAKLSQELAAAMRFNAADAALLELALRANQSVELRHSLDAVGDVDDDGLCALLKSLLSLERQETMEALERENPFFTMNNIARQFNNCRPSQYLRLHRGVQNVLKRAKCSVEDVLSVFFRASPAPRLSMSDFRDAGPSIDLLFRYLKQVIAANRAGVNILLHGKPGTGKTELVRALVKSLDANLLEVPSVGDERDPLPPSRRLCAFTATQECLRERAGAVVLFDEAEDIFPSLPAFMGDFPGASGRSSDRNKGWITQVLDSNPRPAFWVSNAIEQMDPAFVRRFDMVVELNGPDQATRSRLVDQLFAGIPLTKSRLDQLKGQTHFAVGHLERLSDVLRTLGPVDAEEAGHQLEVLSHQRLKAMQVPAPMPSSLGQLPYRSNCVNADADLEALSQALGSGKSARLCLFGAPGTGKTEWARQLANSLGMPLLSKRTSELLGKYVGQTEKCIRNAFDQASRERAVLLIDEADSLLRSRDEAQTGWEVSMVNEMLTAMEGFDGIFIASTNRVRQLDPASARRFDFKVRFSELTADQCALLFDDLLTALAIDIAPQDRPLLSSLRGATPGDFANVYRQAMLSRSMRSPEALLDLLIKEITFRDDPAASRRIGFV